MRFACLGSGSRGNALVVEAGGTRLLVDCGFSVAETGRRLARLGLAATDIDAVLITHEHSDHFGSAARLSARHGLALWMTHGTRAAVDVGEAGDCRCFDSHEPFAIGGIEIHPYPVPHDAREPCQFVFGDGGTRLGLLTDAGRITPHMHAMLADCAALLIECNHDAQMLARGGYPPALKQRVGGDYGHLSNVQAAEFLAALAGPHLRHVAAMHLSEQNNRPELAVRALAAALDCNDDDIILARQDLGFAWHSLP